MIFTEFQPTAHLIKAWVVAWPPVAVSAAYEVAASELPLAE